MFGIDVTASALSSERDQNFHLRSETGLEFVLKIASAADSIEVLDLQNKAMQHLAEREPSVLCPRVCPARSGETIVRVPGRDGAVHFVRLLTFLPGVFLGDYRPHSPALLRSLGGFLGRMDKALASFSHPASRRKLKWDVRDVCDVIRAGLSHIENAKRRPLIEVFLDRFEHALMPVLSSLRTGVIHNDGNYHNLLIQWDGSDAGSARPAGIIDFGDMLHTVTAAEPAIAAAYVLLGKSNPLAAAAEVVGGYHSSFPLNEDELSVLHHLICARLAASVAISAVQQKDEPDKPYLSVSEKQAWDALEKLASTEPGLAHSVYRAACGMQPCPHSRRVSVWLKENPDRIGPVVEPRLEPENMLVLDLSVGSLDLANPEDWSDTARFADLLSSRLRGAGAAVGIGRYNEVRAIYTGDSFRIPSDEIEERRTVHLGIDLFLEPGAPVFAPIDGRVHSFCNNARRLDYGPTIILEHDMGPGCGSFFTLYGHLDLDSLEGLEAGMPVKRGRRIGSVGDFPVNGDWPPHLHFQIISDLLGHQGDFPGVAAPRDREVWLSLCPDPNLILRLPDSYSLCAPRSIESILQARREHLGRSLSVSYRNPLKIVRGFRQYLYDDEGRRYLDAVNNVAHVGHSHPRVVQAIRTQAAILNTNTRYLHENVVQYAERLSATLPDPLRVCFFVNSGSEANDLALRLARAHTGRKGVVVVDGAYHGNLTSLIEISPYKFDGPGGSGAPPHVQKVATPDVYRGLFKGDAEAGTKYARLVEAAIREAGAAVGAFICESVLSCAGQIVLPPGYLDAAYRHIRAVGGVCIADEVQVGLGRVGTHFWAFETQSVVPDIVTAGKSIGNAHPLAAVVTTAEIAGSFANGMEYFNTFGGNPVSCAAGLAVLDVIEQEGLQARALQIGARLRIGLEGLRSRHPLVGDVRGLGLFIGIEFVHDRQTLEPAAAEAAYVVERMKEHGILVSTDGPLHNVIKIKPPLVFSEANADFLMATMDKILSETPLRVTGSYRHNVNAVNILGQEQGLW